MKYLEEKGYKVSEESQHELLVNNLSVKSKIMLNLVRDHPGINAKTIQQQLANPYDLSSEDAELLVKEGKVVVLVSLNIHSTEIGSSQESVELAYELITRSDPKVEKILDNVILLLIPSLNPDGLQMVVEWYRKHVGTPHEGCRMPWLYHHYAGHDDNRDWFMFNLQESRYLLLK